MPYANLACQSTCGLLETSSGDEVWLERRSSGFSVALDDAYELILSTDVINGSKCLSTAFEYFDFENRIPLLLPPCFLRAWHDFVVRPGRTSNCEQGINTLLRVAMVRQLSIRSVRSFYIFGVTVGDRCTAFLGLLRAPCQQSSAQYIDGPMCKQRTGDLQFVQNNSYTMLRSDLERSSLQMADPSFVVRQLCTQRCHCCKSYTPPDFHSWPAVWHTASLSNDVASERNQMCQSHGNAEHGVARAIAQLSSAEDDVLDCARQCC